MSGKQYPVGTYDPPGSDPKNPGNSRFTKGNSSITSGPAKDPNHKGKRFVSVQNPQGKGTYIVDNSGDDDKGKEEGCFIATATLGTSQNLKILDPLKSWRYQVMETSKFGLWLSSLYRSKAPEIAVKVSNLSFQKRVLYLLFVSPAIQVVGWKPSFVKNLALYTLFLAGFILAKLSTNIK